MRRRSELQSRSSSSTGKSSPLASPTEATPMGSPTMPTNEAADVLLPSGPSSAVSVSSATKPKVQNSSLGDVHPSRMDEPTGSHLVDHAEAEAAKGGGPVLKQESVVGGQAALQAKLSSVAMAEAEIEVCCTPTCYMFHSSDFIAAAKHSTS